VRTCKATAEYPAMKIYGNRVRSIAFRRKVVKQFGILHRNPKRERGPNTLPRLRFGLRCVRHKPVSYPRGTTTRRRATYTFLPSCAQCAPAAPSHTHQVPHVEPCIAMNHPEPSTANPGTIITTLTRRWYLWIVPTVLATLVALAYAKWHEPQWRASQALLVRDEAGSETDRQGRFVNIEAMQTFQETIHEVARNHAVVDSTLCELGPPSEYKQPNIWPTDRDIEDAQDAVRVEAPGGAEFGRTEVIHLSVTVAGRERALAFCQALCDKLDERMRRLRNDKAQGMIAELDRSAEMAQNDLAAATVRLQSLERKVGSDLGELRVLSEVGAGESNLRSSLNQLEAELRDANATLRSRQQQKKLLENERLLISLPKAAHHTQ
jgi:hypothetical protein